MMAAIIFSSISIGSIVAGGLISAFSARKPTRLTAWISAYLVLVIGIIQLGIITAWRSLGQPDPFAVSVALLIYNIGNGAVISGTLQAVRIKYRQVSVNVGGVFIASAMTLLLIAVRKLHLSWQLIEYLMLVVTILISMPIGLVLSHRRHAKTGSGD